MDGINPDPVPHVTHTFTKGEAKSVTLPEASCYRLNSDGEKYSEGVGLNRRWQVGECARRVTYRLAADWGGYRQLPEGLSFDKGTRVLSGTPTETWQLHGHHYTARGPDGYWERIRVEIEVVAGGSAGPGNTGGNTGGGGGAIGGGSGGGSNAPGNTGGGSGGGQGGGGGNTGGGGGGDIGGGNTGGGGQGGGNTGGGGGGAQAVPTSVERQEIPKVVTLEQNYPNPFNPQTRIEYALPVAARVHLAVYDVTGRPVETLQNGIMPAGAHSVTFDATGLPAGVYVYRLEAAGASISGRMALVK